jgi:hypothetical protein
MAARSWNRREALKLGAGAACAALLPWQARGAEGSGNGLQAGMAESDLVYVTPLRGNGSESRCQAEVWFVADGGDAVVVTATDAWRARAVAQGLDRARLWVGDVGVWTDSDGAYRQLPSTLASASMITEPAEHARLLEVFGDKYSLEWIIWGPRFRNGLEEGSRVMIRYAPV